MKRFDLLALGGLVLLGVALYRLSLFGGMTYIGDSDRLYHNLDFRKIDVDGFREGRLRTWVETMLLGYPRMGLPHAFPGLDVLVASFFPGDAFFRIAGILSCIVLISAGWAGYFFIKDTCGQSFPAFVGSALYFLSEFSILRISQGEGCHAVLLIVPLGLLALRRARKGKAASRFFLLELLFSILFGFLFLQDAAYALLLLGAYAVYRSLRLRTWGPVLLFSGAAVASLLMAAPRIVTVLEDFRESVRMGQRVNPGNHPGSYVSAFESLRWFNGRIFGRYQSEAVELGNGWLNLHEGVSLFTAGFAAWLVCLGFIRFRNRWLGIFCTRDRDLPFHAGVIVFIMAIFLCKPLYFLVWLSFGKLDFEHARICQIALLPLCTVTACLLGELVAGTRIHWACFAGMGALSFAVLEMVDEGLLGNAHGVKIHRFILLTGEAARSFGELACIVLLFLLAKRFPRSELAGTLPGWLLGWLMLGSVYWQAEGHVNGAHTRDIRRPFYRMNFLCVSENEFSLPSEEVVDRVRDRLEAERYRTVLVGAPCFPLRPVPHIAAAWNLRLVEGYLNIAPRRVAQLPWPKGVVGRRTVLLGGVPEMPWRLLGVLNVKYGMVVDQEVFTGRSFGGDREVNPEGIRVVKNPCRVLPRHFWVRRVEGVEDEAAAARWLRGKIEGEGDPDLTVVSVGEGGRGSEGYAMGGDIRARYDGDRVDLEFDPVEAPRYLVLNELVHPRWRAYGGGEELRMEPANVVMRGIRIPGGVGRVELRFEPFLTSRWAAALFLFGILLTIVIGIAMKRISV